LKKIDNQRTTGSRYLKNFRIKEPPVLGISKAFKEPLGFTKELEKT
jgi:hypothetical protein